MKNVFRNFAAFVDGRGYAGQVDELTPPKIALKTEEHRAGGMDAPIELDMGMEKLESEITFSGMDKDVLKLFGIAAGETVPFTFRGALESESGGVNAAVISLRGKVKGVDFGTWKAGEKAPVKVSIAARFYKLELAGEVVHEIDVLNNIRIIGGKDQLKAQREAMGI